MHLYLFDYRLKNKKYKKKLNQLDFKLASLSISGEIIYLKKSDDPKSLLSQIKKYNPANIIITGDDNTFLHYSHLILRDFSLRKNIVLGFMPLLGSEYLAKFFNLPQNMQIAQIISRRIARTIHLSKITPIKLSKNARPSEKKSISHLFFAPLEIKTSQKINFKLRLNNILSVSAYFKKMIITNINLEQKEKNKNLTLLAMQSISLWGKIKYKKELKNKNYFKMPRISFFKALKKIAITSPVNTSLYLNNKPFATTPCEIETTNKSFKMITGPSL